MVLLIAVAVAQGASGKLSWPYNYHDSPQGRAERNKALQLKKTIESDPKWQSCEGQIKQLNVIIGKNRKEHVLRLASGEGKSKRVAELEKNYNSCQKRLGDVIKEKGRIEAQHQLDAWKNENKL